MQAKPLREILHENGLVQGAVLMIKGIEFKDRYTIKLSDESVWVVISHDCDIARNEDTEPYIEIIRAKEIKNVDGNLTNGKSTRELDIDLGAVKYRLHINDKRFIEKKHLTEIKLSELGITDKNLDILKYWLAYRYSRSVFPDEFNRRFMTSGAHKKLLELLKKKAKNIRGIYLRLSPTREIEDDQEAYKLAILLLVMPEVASDKGVMADVHECFDGIVKCFDKINGINLIEKVSEIRSTDDIYISEIEEFDKWDLDEISFSKGGYENKTPTSKHYA